MKIHRFFSADNLGEHVQHITDERLVHQIRKVLRIRPGEQIRLFDGASECLYTMKGYGDDSIEVFFESHVPLLERGRKVTIALSLIRKELFEFAVQKCVEIGVSSIVPLMCARTERTNFDSTRMRKIMIEATEQSGWGTVPELSGPKDFDDFLSETSSSEAQKVLFHTEKGAKEVGASGSGAEIIAMIGPEGGFEDGEVEKARAAGCEVASLGKSVLRAETAAIVAAAKLTD